MHMTRNLKTLAIALMTVAGTMAVAAPASAASPYQWRCNYTSFGLRCYLVQSQTTQQSTPTATKPTTPTQPTPSTPSATTGLTTAEQQMLDLVNQERAKAGLAPLKADLELTKLARLKSQDMISHNYFSHQSPTYGSPFDMMKSFGITYQTAGENIAGNSSVTGAHTALMNSTGHRANILNPNYTHIGIGIVSGGSYGIMFTQQFIGR